MGVLINIFDENYQIVIDTREENEKRMKPVRQYDKNGNFIAEYCSIAEAERITKIRHIYECVSNKSNRKSAGGYIWRLAKEN